MQRRCAPTAQNDPGPTPHLRQAEGTSLEVQAAVLLQDVKVRLACFDQQRLLRCRQELGVCGGGAVGWGWQG